MPAASSVAAVARLSRVFLLYLLFGAAGALNASKRQPSVMLDTAFDRPKWSPSIFCLLPPPGALMTAQGKPADGPLKQKIGSP